MRQYEAASARHVLRQATSGAKTDPSQLRRVLDRFSAGDVLMMTRFDSLARNVLNTSAIIAGSKEQKDALRRRDDREAVKQIARTCAVHHSINSRPQAHG